MIKNKAVNSVLTGILAVSLAASVIYCYRCVKHGRDIRALAQQAATNQVNMPLLQSLITDCVVYSATNQAIKPVLESLGMKSPTTGSSAKPAAK